MTASARHILIVGSGIGGLTLAVALHRQGYLPELVERVPSWPAIGAGIVLHANGVRALRQLGMGTMASYCLLIVWLCRFGMLRRV